MTTSALNPTLRSLSLCMGNPSFTWHGIKNVITAIFFGALLLGQPAAASLTNRLIVPNFKDAGNRFPFPLSKLHAATPQALSFYSYVSQLPILYQCPKDENICSGITFYPNPIKTREKLSQDRLHDQAGMSVRVALMSAMDARKYEYFEQIIHSNRLISSNTLKSVLQLAVENGRSRFVDIILQSKREIPAELLKDALNTSVTESHPKCLKVILDSHRDLPPLFDEMIRNVAEKGDLRCLNVFLNSKIETPVDWGYALELAAKNNKNDCCKAILNSTKEITDVCLFNALAHVIKENNHELLEFVLKSKHISGVYLYLTLLTAMNNDNMGFFKTILHSNQRISNSWLEMLFSQAIRGKQTEYAAVIKETINTSVPPTLTTFMSVAGMTIIFRVIQLLFPLHYSAWRQGAFPLI